MNLVQGSRRQSFRQLRELVRKHLTGNRKSGDQPAKDWLDKIDEMGFYINHSLASRDGKHVYFFARTRFGNKEIAINVREKDLLKYAISMQEISLAVAQKNMDITTGMIRGGVQELNVRSKRESRGCGDAHHIITRLASALFRH